MKTSLASLTLLFAFVLPARAATPATQPAGPEQLQLMKNLVDDFAQQVSRLKVENEVLKNKVENLQLENNRLLAELNALKLSAPSKFNLAPFTLTPLPQQLPENNTRSFQFNGRTVYVEPIIREKSSLLLDAPKNGDLIDDRPAQK